MFQQSLLLIPFLFAALVTSFANPGVCTGSCWSHDPAVIQRTSDGKYFRFSTGGGIEITTASSISGPWTIQGKALASGSSINLSGNTDLWVRRYKLVGHNTNLLSYSVTGPRREQSWGLVLHVLCCFLVRQSIFSHRSCNIFYHGGRVLDRSRLSWCHF